MNEEMKEKNDIEAFSNYQGPAWSNIFWVVLAHILSIGVFFTFTWGRIATAFFLYWLIGGLGITVGYHRLLTHRSFECPNWLRHFLAFIGCLAWEGSPLSWVAIHRIHHFRSDKEGDPHSPVKKGFWWAHVLWVFRFHPLFDRYENYRKYVKDLDQDPFMRFLDRYHGFFQAIIALLLLFSGTFFYGWRVGFAWVIWGVFARLVFTFHSTWLVNSATHIWGYRSYRTDDHSTNNLFVAMLTWGEGWHNNHHAFPNSARHGLGKGELDISYLCILFFKKLGIAWDIKAPSLEEKSEKRISSCS